MKEQQNKKHLERLLLAESLLECLLGVLLHLGNNFYKEFLEGSNSNLEKEEMGYSVQSIINL